MSTCPTEYWLWLQCALGAGAKTDELLAYFETPIKLSSASAQPTKIAPYNATDTLE